MKFDYEMYLRSDFYMPLIGMAFSFLFTLGSVIALIQNIRKGALDNIIPICFGIVFFIVFLTQLIRGIPLLKDSELNTVEVQGEIDKIEKINFGTRHTVEGNILFSSYITINGKKYYSASPLSIKEGNQVKLIVLENSGYVLEIIKEGEMEI